MSKDIIEHFPYYNKRMFSYVLCSGFIDIALATVQITDEYAMA